jgi:Rv2525c-like, glycoside hydrolase-like domain
MRRVLPTVALVLALGVGVAACKPSPNPPQPPQGFDTCAAPSLSTMQTWWDNSPFTSVGIYVGGANRGCSQPNLTSSWVQSVIGQGWKLFPIWVGPQASCTNLGNTTKLPVDEFWATMAGYNEAIAAADRMDSFGFKWLAPVYYDMEAYPRDSACIKSVQAFSNGWTYGLNGRGYIAGLYSSQCSGIVDVAAIYNTARYRLQAIWIAAWNNTPNIFGFTGTCPVSDSFWPDHQRLHQFIGGHNETWGGVTINIDSDAVDGWTYPK